MTTKTLKKALCWGNSTIRKNNRIYPYIDASVISNSKYTRLRSVIQTHLTRYGYEHYPIDLVGLALCNEWYVAIYTFEGVEYEERISIVEFNADLDNYDRRLNPKAEFMATINNFAGITAKYSDLNICEEAIDIVYPVIKEHNGSLDFTTHQFRVWVGEQIEISTCFGKEYFNEILQSVQRIIDLVKEHQCSNLKSFYKRVDLNTNVVYKNMELIVNQL
jgi:hypothetical protein